MKRAQHPEQKDQRRRDILQRTRELFVEKDYRELRLQEIAESLGLVKGTLYRYFPTKQDLFMELYREDLSAWLETWRVGPPSREANLDWIASFWVETLVSQPSLVRLIGSFHSHIEPDLSDEGLLTFKLYIRDFFLEAASALEGLVPSVTGQGFSLIMDAYILVQGCAPLCFPPGRIRDLLRDTPALTVFRLDFAEVFPPLLKRMLSSPSLGGGCPASPSPVSFRP